MRVPCRAGDFAVTATPGSPCPSGDLAGSVADGRACETAVKRHEEDDDQECQCRPGSSLFALGTFSLSSKDPQWFRDGHPGRRLDQEAGAARRALPLTSSATPGLSSPRDSSVPGLDPHRGEEGSPRLFDVPSQRLAALSGSWAARRRDPPRVWRRRRTPRAPGPRSTSSGTLLPKRSSESDQRWPRVRIGNGAASEAEMMASWNRLFSSRYSLRRSGISRASIPLVEGNRAPSARPA